MTEVTETHLPGVGVRHEFTTSAGERLSVLSHRTGRRELAVYDRADPDACSTVLHLSPDDTHTTVMSVQRLEGVAIDWIRIRPGSAQAGTTIGAGRLRTRTGTSVVAIIRGDETIAAPGPDVTFASDDIAVAVGTSDGLRQLRALLEH